MLETYSSDSTIEVVDQVAQRQEAHQGHRPREAVPRPTCFELLGIVDLALALALGFILMRHR